MPVRMCHWSVIVPNGELGPRLHPQSLDQVPTWLPLNQTVTCPSPLIWLLLGSRWNTNLCHVLTVMGVGGTTGYAASLGLASSLTPTRNCRLEPAPFSRVAARGTPQRPWLPKRPTPACQAC